MRKHLSNIPQKYAKLAGRLERFPLRDKRLCREPGCVRKVGHAGFHQGRNNHRWGRE